MLTSTWSVNLGMPRSVSRSVAPKAFADAVESGNTAAVKAFLDAGQRADQLHKYTTKDGNECTIPLLAFAVSKGHPNVLKLLLEAGSAYDDKSWINDVCTNYGCTAVCWAYAIDQSYSGKPVQVEMAKLLIDAGADLEPSVLGVIGGMTGC